MSLGVQAEQRQAISPVLYFITLQVPKLAASRRPNGYVKVHKKHDFERSLKTKSHKKVLNLSVLRTFFRVFIVSIVFS